MYIDIDRYNKEMHKYVILQYMCVYAVDIILVPSDCPRPNPWKPRNADDLWKLVLKARKQILF